MGIVGIGSPQSRSLQVVGESRPCVKSGQLTFTLGCDVDAAHRKRATEVMRERGFQDFEANIEGLPRARQQSVSRLSARHHTRPLACPGGHRGTPGRQGRLLREAADPDGRRVACASESGQGDRPHPADRQPAAHRLWRHVPPGGRAGPRRPPRQDQDHRVPHRRQPDERPDPGGARSRGPGLGPLARPDREGTVSQEGQAVELPLRVPLVVRLLRRQDDRLGSAPPGHRAMGPGQGRQRTGGRRGAEGG